MIRRGFWLAAGAVLGVTGYRRVMRLARALTFPRATGTHSLPGTGPTAGPQMLAPPRTKSHVARAVATAKFVHDVREGMAEYRDLHRGESDPTLRGRTLETPTLEARTLETQGYRTLSGEPAEPGDSRRGPREP
jgi:hypothetical protein